MRLFIAFSMVALLASATHASEVVVSHQPAQQSLWLDFGWEPTWILQIGYTHPLKTDWPSAIHGALTVPLVLAPRLNAWKLAAGSQTLAPLYRNWRMTVYGGAVSVRAQDATGTKTGFGGELALRPGHYAGRWAVAADLHARHILSSWFTHSRAAQDLFNDRYPDRVNGSIAPKNGWYANPSSTFGAGVAGGGMISHRISIWGRGGYAWIPQAQGIAVNPSIGQLPFYIHSAVGYQW
jgi:hypothetical protein